MKILYFILYFVLLLTRCDGESKFSTEQNVITIQALNAWSVYAVDIDGDGDIDVLSASSGDDKIAWYENTDGKGTFGSQNIITTQADSARSVYAADIDGDGDIDVLSASYHDDKKIAWYENTDGKGTFNSTTQNIITTQADGANSVFAVDIDGDGDIDVLSASSNDDKIAWYENTDGKGTFISTAKPSPGPGPSSPGPTPSPVPNPSPGPGPSSPGPTPSPVPNPSPVCICTSS